MSQKSMLLHKRRDLTGNLKVVVVGESWPESDFKFRPVGQSFCVATQLVEEYDWMTSRQGGLKSSKACCTCSFYKFFRQNIGD